MISSISRKKQRSKIAQKVQNSVILKIIISDILSNFSGSIYSTKIIRGHVGGGWGVEPPRRKNFLTPQEAKNFRPYHFLEKIFRPYHFLAKNFDLLPFWLKKNFWQLFFRKDLKKILTPPPTLKKFLTPPHPRFFQRPPPREILLAQLWQKSTNYV